MIIFHNYSGMFESAKPNRLVFGFEDAIGKQAEAALEQIETDAEKISEDGDDVQKAEHSATGTEAKGDEQLDKYAKPTESSAIETPEGPDMERKEKTERRITNPEDRKNVFDQFAEDEAARKRGGQINTKIEKSEE